MPALEVLEEGGKAHGYGEGEEGGPVGGGGDQVEEGGEEEARGFFFGGETQQLRVEGNHVLFSGEGGLVMRFMW